MDDPDSDDLDYREPRDPFELLALITLGAAALGLVAIIWLCVIMLGRAVL